MAEHLVESVPFGYVSTAKQATFQVAPRCVGQMLLSAAKSTDSSAKLPN